MGQSRKEPRQIWTIVPAEKDFVAAEGYLSLLMPSESARLVVEALRTAETIHHEPKDLLRASRLPLLEADDGDIDAERKQIKRREPLPPVLLLRGDWAGHARPLEIADGYHRICASFEADENTKIPCRIADVPQG